MLGYLKSAVQHLATCWTITRLDGQVFYYTDRDEPFKYNGNVYQSAGGFSASALSSNANLSVANMEANALFGGTVKQHDIQAGLWDLASISVFLVNPYDTSAGQVTMSAGQLGKFTLFNGRYNVEVRSLAQVMQQGFGNICSPTCRAVFGDSRCTVNLAPLTFTGTVGAVTQPAQAWTDSSLTQTGPVVAFTDTQGQRIPSDAPFTIQIVAPDGGAFSSGISVLEGNGVTPYTQVGSSPGNFQYTLTSGGLYTFSANQAANECFINYNYEIGYFAYGTVKWLTGLNAGYSMEVKTNSPGSVQLVMPMIYPVQPGDTYSITAGCDKQMGTCKTRFSNLVNFRGEPYVPGNDTILALQVQS
jgi:hypothetical protein